MTDRQDWNAIVTKNAPRSGSFLQSFEWGEYQNAIGAETVRLETGDGDAKAIVSAQIRPLPLGMKTLYVPRGPVAAGSPKQTERILELLGDEAKKRGAIALRIDPATQGLAVRGDSVRPLQPQTTIILDLKKTEDELLAAMHEKTRYNVRLAAKKGVHVREGGKELFLDFWRLLEASAKRDRFHTHPRSHYEKMLETLSGGLGDRTRCTARIFLAEEMSRPLAAMILIAFGDDIVYLHGGSSDEARNVMAPYALHWEAIRLAKAKGYRHYDFWGIAPEGVPKHPLAGVTRFKRGFGGDISKSPDSVELPVSRFWYTIYALVQAVRRRR